MALERNSRVLTSNKSNIKVTTKTIDFYETTAETKQSNLAAHYSSSKEFDTREMSENKKPQCPSKSVLTKKQKERTSDRAVLDYYKQKYND